MKQPHILAVGILALTTACAAGPGFGTREQDATVHIETAIPSLCWSGAIGGATHDGCGNADIPVHDQMGLFSSNVQKRDATGAQITISIVINDQVVAENSTSADYGVASVVAPLR